MTQVCGGVNMAEGLCDDEEFQYMNINESLVRPCEVDFTQFLDKYKANHAA